jgi:hypothetical protein
MQRVVAHRDVHALTVARLAGLPREVVLQVRPDGETAQHHVAEQAPSQVPRRRHHPAHAKQRTELFGVATRIRAGADHLLQSHDIGVHRPDHVGNPLALVRPSRPRQRWML